jgi:carbon storage regulator
MLVLSRKSMESIHIGDKIVITVLELGRNKVRIGIDAPTETSVRRSELEPKQASRHLAECASPGLT